MTASEPAWQIVEYRGRAGLVRLEADWRRLYAAMPQRTGFHAYEAHLAYVDHLMAVPDELRCFALTDGQQVRAICLLEAETDRVVWRPIHVWRMPFLPHMWLRDVIGPEDDARRELIPALVGHLRHAQEGPPLLYLGPLPETSVVWDGVRELDKRQHCISAAGVMK